MKIKITDHIPVEKHIRPEVGGIYEVVEKEERGDRGQIVYFIEVGGGRVGVFGRECEVVHERSVCEAIREAEV